MPKYLKWTLISVGLVALLAFVGFRYMTSQTKKASPEETATFVVDDLEVKVTYSRPYKKGRAIFGTLVPYGRVWRTGANEATTFTVNKDFIFGEAPLKAGKYTLWSIPGADEWSVILNSKMYGWGVNFDGEAQRDPLADVAQVKVPVRHIVVPMEQFTIAVEGDPTELTLTWDDVQVGVPVAVQ
jgi:hypothetical protein